MPSPLDFIRKLAAPGAAGSRGDESVGYESAWDRHARRFHAVHPHLEHIGDEWTGIRAGAASSNAEYVELIRSRIVGPNVEQGETVLEIGIGGGRTASMIRDAGARVIAADISAEMIRATRKRLGSEGVSYVKLDGRTLDAIPDRSADACIVFDTMVHLEPRDIFNYLARIPAKLREDSRRFCLFHHTDVLSELGFQRFLLDWSEHLMGRRTGDTFSLMTAPIMRRFLEHLGYTDIVMDDAIIPRDVVWTCTAPASVQPDALRPTHPLFKSDRESLEPTNPNATTSKAETA